MGITEGEGGITGSLKTLLLVTTHRWIGTAELWRESCSRGQWQEVEKRHLNPQNKEVGLRSMHVRIDQHCVPYRKGGLF